jgi:radical SAM family uncharacterized protein
LSAPLRLFIIPGEDEIMVTTDTLDNILPRVMKPARYTGGEWNSVIKDWDKVGTRVALAYPDIYEVGMSNLALMILYDLLNKEEGILAERVYAPWVDMEQAMRSAGIPLYSLETRHPLGEFDVIGFTLPYELNYTNVLNMLDLAQIPLIAAERTNEHPLVIGGGSGTYNPEPLADFFDLFVIGEGEEVLLELLKVHREWGADKGKLLSHAAEIEGIYVPTLYEVLYNEDGIVSEVRPRFPEAKPIVTKRIVDTLPPAPTKVVVPFVEAVHDRAMIEIQRGCTQGCRFCQAGMIYRPLRERPLEEIVDTADVLLAATGYEELSLVSLSSCNYSRIEELVKALLARHAPRHTSLSLPSLRIDSFSVELAKMFHGQRKTGLTFAPEAGSPRLRRVINKLITDDDILNTAEAAYGSGWHRIKLYFMVGLPTETRPDVEAIGALAKQVRDIGRQIRGKRAQVSVSVATFIPKPYTPFQWLPLEKENVLEEKLALLRRLVRGPGLRLSWNDPATSLLETTLSRGDRRLGKVIHEAWQRGARFDAWGESFDAERWWAAFSTQGLDPAFYAYRERSLEEILPWDHINSGVSKEFLVQECQRSLREETTLDCRGGPCLACGILATLAPDAKTRRQGLWGCPSGEEIQKQETV